MPSTLKSRSFLGHSGQEESKVTPHSPGKGVLVDVCHECRGVEGSSVG